MLQGMLRVMSVVLGTGLIAVRACILGALVVATGLCACYSLYWLLRYGGLPDLNIAGLYPGAYEYLLPPDHITLNTAYIFYIELPLLVSLGALLLLVFLLDRLGHVLFHWLEEVLSGR